MFLYLMPYFQSDFSSKPPETSDETIPQKVKKENCPQGGKEIIQLIDPFLFAC